MTRRDPTRAPRVDWRAVADDWGWLIPGLVCVVIVALCTAP